MNAQLDTKAVPNENEPSIVALLAAAEEALRLAGHVGSSVHFSAAVGNTREHVLERLTQACLQQKIPARLCTMSASSWPTVKGVVLMLEDASQATGKGSEYEAIALIEWDGEGDNGESDVRVFRGDGQVSRSLCSQRELCERHLGQALVIPYAEPSVSRDTDEKSGFSSWLFSGIKALRYVYRDVLLASLLINVFVLASPLFLMNVYDRVVPNQAVETLWVLAIGVAVVFLFDVLIRSLRHFFLERAGVRLDLGLSARLFQHALNLRAEHFPRSVGAFASYFRDFDSIRQFLTAGTITLLVDLPFALLFFIIIFSLGGLIALPVVIAGVLMLLLGFLFHFPLKRAIEAAQQSAARKQAILVESLTELETIKVFNAEQRAQRFWEMSVQKLADSALSTRTLADRLTLSSQFVMQLTVVTVVVVGVYQIADQSMSMGALIACVLLAGRALAPLAQIASLCSQYYQAKTALRSLNALTHLDVEQGRGRPYLEHGEIKGTIEFSDASFEYEASHPVLNKLSLRIEAGEKVALLGRVGSGKSSLLKLLLGLGHASQGLVTLDGLDIRHINPADVRQAVGYVPQDIELVSGTLRDNVALKHPRASDAEIFEALKRAGMDEFVNNHALGLDLPIYEQGRGLSGGQRQGVAIARALLGEPRILLFDELTSAMDNQTEARVIANLSALPYSHTLLLSTHRASLLKLVDRIVVLEKGRVVADGPKEQVLDALKKGLIHTGQVRS